MLNEIFAVIEFIVKAFIHIWPYLLLTVPISVAIHLSTVMKFMLLAFFLEALIIRYVPENLIAGLLDRKQWFAVPLSAMVGVPVYTTNLTALGLVSGLLNKGMNPGAALTFLIAGAMTTLPAMAAVFGLVKRKIFILYIGFAVAGSMLFGFLYNIILTSGFFPIQ